ncbi:MAG: aldehyde ferredoxin oxidoreductase N-terminal domain-containing protein [Nitrososphaeria archaeon]
MIFSTGPLAGTPSPSSGRTEVTCMAPQSYPICWVADSGFGGDFAMKMKFSGYDAIMIIGKSDSPKYIYVQDGGTKLLDGSSLWGLYTIKVQQSLIQKHGADCAIATIGPAGENLVRFAVIMTKTENAAGQGGFGAVMGSKNLKALVIKGSQRVKVAKPEVLMEEVKKITSELPRGSPKGIGVVRPLSDSDRRGHYITRKHSGCTACGECMTNTDAFPDYYEGVQQRWTGTGIISGDMHCVGRCAPLLLDNDWEDKEEAFEFNKLADMLGINHWEIFAGMNWFIQNCYNDGKLTELMGERLNLNKNGPAVFPREAPTQGLLSHLLPSSSRG